MDSTLIARIPVADWQPGNVIASRYELVDKIGMGGMGAVWKVLYRDWDRLLALKVPLPELVGSIGLKERFVREAETWVGLGVHPHIVQCWFVLAVSGLPSLFLDYLPNGSLKDRIADGRVSPGSWKEILEIAMGIASGLVHAHARGVVHRDIKPENLLFRADGRVCVTDFGLVKTAFPDDIKRSDAISSSDEPGISGSGAYLGTPQYGAPEQWGAAEKVTPAADIYAFGITLYEMCSGRRPFDVEGDPSVTINNLINAHLKTLPPDPREFFAEIPEELVLLSLACLEKNPERRPPSMKAVYDVLSQFYTGLTGEVFPEIVQLPNAQNPDILNNSAVSLLSVGKIEHAKSIWRLGLRQDSMHPECVYNLTQLERRQGTIGIQEALHRLQRSKANYPLALLCIEQGLYKEALAVLEEARSEDPIEKGLVQRAIGDANMYLGRYFLAELAYRHALKLVPNDDYSNRRRNISARGLRGLDNVIDFPLRTSRFDTSIDSTQAIACVDDDSTHIVLATADSFMVLDTKEYGPPTIISREENPRPPEKVWAHGSRMLLQEEGAFQLRTLPDLELVGRKSGKVLATTGDLSRMVLLTRDGPTLFSFEDNTFQPISCTDEGDNLFSFLATFDNSGTQLCLLLPSGHLGQLDSDYKTTSFDWPSRSDLLKHPTALALSSDGRVYIGYACGTVHCFDIIGRKMLYATKLPGPIYELKLTLEDHCLLVDLKSIKILLNERGESIWQGDTPAILTSGGRFLLAFVQRALNLYNCSPFYLIRRWEQTQDAIDQLAISPQGGIAVSLTPSGHLQVWEVYEEHRVYERLPLLAISQGYDELVRGAKAFPEAILDSRACLQNDDLVTSYKKLREARAIVGYGQNPQALELNWQLVTRMGRDSIDAVWDRLTVSGKDIRAIDLSEDGSMVLLVIDDLVTLRRETETDSRVIWSYQAESLVLAAKIRNESVAVIQNNGLLLSINLTSGEVEEKYSLADLKLNNCHIGKEELLFIAKSGELGRYSLKHHKIVALSAPIAEATDLIFPWIDSFVIVTSPSRFGIVALGRKPGREVLPFTEKTYQPEVPVTFCELDEGNRVIVLGLANGIIAILDKDTGRLRYAVGDVSAAISGFCLVSKLALGVITTDRGHLYFWDLRANKLLEGLLAHRGGIKSLRVNQQGRYLVTSGLDGTARLWETSWTASLSTESPPDLDWLPLDTSSGFGFFRRLFKS